MSMEQSQHLDASVIIEQKEGKYYLACRRYGLIVESEDLEAGWSDLARERDARRALYGRAGIEEPEASHTNPLNQVGRSFWIKTSVISAIVVITLFLASIPLNNAVFSAAGLAQGFIGQLKASTSPKRLGKALEQFAVTIQQLTPARREELRKAIRTIAVELEPLAAEMRPLFLGPDGGRKGNQPRQ